MKKVLVTGATGFIGSYVVQELLSRGCSVIATSSRRETALQMTWFNSVKYLEFDLSNLEAHTNYYDFFEKPDILIHLAWQGLPNYKSLFHFEINLPLHYQFIKNLVENGCNDILISGTCFEYGMTEGELSENIPSNPQNPYALAKDSLRKFLVELQKKNDFIFKWARLFYLYGKGQNPNSLLSQLNTALDRGEKIFNMSGGEQIRDYLPVEAAASYLVSIALNKSASGIINCCSGKPVKVKQLVMEHLAKQNRTIELNLGYYPYPDFEPMSFWGDNSKLQSILNEQ